MQAENVEFHWNSVLEELLPEAEKRNIVICIENIILPINTPENLWKIKKEFDYNRIAKAYMEMEE